MVVTYTFEFQSEDDLDETIEVLLKKYGVTGELHVRPLDSGRWRLSVHSEKKLRDSVLEKLKGRLTSQS